LASLQASTSTLVDTVPMIRALMEFLLSMVNLLFA
jgi:hypothetical protein